MAPSSEPRRSVLQRLADEVLFRSFLGICSILRALPSRWILAAGDAVGTLVYGLDRRGRRVGHQNLRAVFGDALAAPERRATLLASFRNSTQSVLLLLHVSPMTKERYLEWVDVPPEDGERLLSLVSGARGGVAVSGHIGNWELLLGVPSALDRPNELVFLAEGLSYVAVDRVLAHLRGSGGGASAMRHGGARALNSQVRKGGVAALLADRNVRSTEGGIWAPFLGLQARTTPLPAWLVVRNGVPIRPVLCLPKGDGRYRIWVGPNLAEGVDASDKEAAILEITTRANRVLDEVIRARPEIWNWTLKRFKSRPDRELGPYPPYSLWDG